MSDWKQAEKTAQPVLNLVGASEVEDCDLASSPVAQAGTSGVRDDEFPAPLPRPAISGASGDESVAEAPTASVMNGVDSPGPEVAAPSLSLSGAVPPDLGERYQVLSLLGEGGMGMVWKVFDRDLQEIFAIKVLRPELVADETLTKRFAKEAKLASELTHANIAAIFGPCFDKQGHPGIIMRYVDGESLAELLAREGKLSVERSTFILRQICDALAHSHMKGIVHRDIKPSNIIIAKTDDGSDLVQLVDFGIAQSVYTKATATQALTRSVDVLGSPSYMSPEQFLGKEITAKSDIYSLGCVVYEMLTGAPPFVDENPVRLVLKHLNEAPDLLKLPESMRGLVSNCLCKEAFNRPGRVEELLEWIDLEGPGLNGEERRLPISIAILTLVVVSLLSTIGDRLVFSLFLLVLAVGTMFVNQLTVARGPFSREFEVSFFSASVCSALFALCSWLFPFPWQGISYLLTYPLLIFLNLNPVAVEVIHKLPIALVRSVNPAVKSFKIVIGIARILATILAIQVSLIAIVLGLTGCHHLASCLICGDLGFQFLIAHLLSALSLQKFVMCLVSLSIIETFLREKLEPANFFLKFRQVVLCYSLGLFAGLLCILSVWQPGMDKLLRQVSASDYGVTLAQNGELEVEALKYPRGGLFNRARLVSMQPLDPKDKVALRRKLELLNQIVTDKAETDKSTLSQAYRRRYYLRATMGVKWSELKGDWDLALSNIQAVLAERAPAQSPSLSGSMAQAFRNAERPILGPLDYWLDYPVEDYGKDAYELAESAVNNLDLERAKKALVVAKDYVHKDTIYNLEERIAKLEGER